MKFKNIVSFLFTLFIGLTALQAQQDLPSFFKDANSFFLKHVEGDKVNYKTAKESGSLYSLIKTISDANLENATPEQKKAFYINAYNLYVIKKVVDKYPLSSVKDVGGFFDGKKITVAGEQLTLNDLEKEKLIKVTNDARLHFVLVCGAVGCPPIINKAYLPSTLDSQLDAQTKKALNSPEFLKFDVQNNKAELSQIFNWYAADFGKSKENVLAFINKYRALKIPESVKISYYGYDWLLNDVSSASSGSLDGLSNNAIRYVVSSTIPQGEHEIKLFNNLYSENKNGVRQNFYNTSLSYLYGLNRRLNIGIAARYARASKESADHSPFKVLGRNRELDKSGFRHALSFAGPQFRWAPVEKWGNFSIQSQFLIPTNRDNKGVNGAGLFLDWSRPRWFTQFFNDLPLGSNFSLFTELDVSFEDLGRKSEGADNQLTLPLTAIISYFPHPKVTFYGLTNFSPQLTEAFSSARQPTYFFQLGTGAKYQLTRKLEFELLYTAFRNQGLLEANGVANTFNFGVRVSL